ncbi:uncharacterized protein [Nicotiana tomentosiformis]|uniref:uncharacterized protein n=1 Tax=Nicotiana tomentosiformis TaxID=4098 RepID=UPI00388C6875
MLRACVIDFGGSWDQFLQLTEFAYNNSYQSSIQMAPYEALYGRRCRSSVGWFELGEARLLGTDLVHDALDKGEGSAEGITHEGKRGKLSSRFVGPFEVLRRIGEMAYKLALPPSLSSVHLVFHVSTLRKYIGDPSHVLDFSTVQLDSDMTYDVEPVAILEWQVRKLRSKDIALVKVQ